MALRSGVDLIAIATRGVYTETYVSSTDPDNIASLFASYGFLEDTPYFEVSPDRTIRGDWLWEYFE